MGREQGDHLDDPVIYVAEVDGETQERPAYTPADHVNMAARGWKPKDSSHADAAAAAAPTTTAERPAGGRAPAATSPSPRADAGDTAGSSG